jgi:hypothetical protein
MIKAGNDIINEEYGMKKKNVQPLTRSMQRYEGRRSKRTRLQEDKT